MNNHYTLIYNPKNIKISVEEIEKNFTCVNQVITSLGTDEKNSYNCIKRLDEIDGKYKFDEKLVSKNTILEFYKTIYVYDLETVVQADGNLKCFAAGLMNLGDVMKRIN